MKHGACRRSVWPATGHKARATRSTWQRVLARAAGAASASRCNGTRLARASSWPGGLSLSPSLSPSRVASWSAQHSSVAHLAPVARLLIASTDGQIGGECTSAQCNAFFATCHSLQGEAQRAICQATGSTAYSLQQGRETLHSPGCPMVSPKSARLNDRERAAVAAAALQFSVGTLCILLPGKFQCHLPAEREKEKERSLKKWCHQATG